MNLDEINEYSNLIANWLGNEKAMSKVSAPDLLAIATINAEMLEKVKPIYDKYHKTKRKSNVQTANLLGEEFADKALKGFIKSFSMKDE